MAWTTWRAGPPVAGPFASCAATVAARAEPRAPTRAGAAALPVPIAQARRIPPPTDSKRLFAPLPTRVALEEIGRPDENSAAIRPQLSSVKLGAGGPLDAASMLLER